MSQPSAREVIPLADDTPSFDWRDWLSFVGSVLGTALIVSVALGAIALMLSAGGG